MGIYISILVLSFTLSVLEPFLKRNRVVDAGVFVLVFLTLWLLAGLRNDVGMDYNAYKDLYRMSGDLYEMREMGFIKIVEFFNFLNIPFSFFCLCYAFLTQFLIFRFVKNYSPYLFFSLLIYYALGNYYFSSFNVMRQSLATAIFMNCLSLISNGKFWKYLFVMLLTSFCIHFSAIILIPLYFVLRKQYVLSFKLIGIVSTVLFGGLFIKIIELSPYAVYLTFDAYSSAVPLTHYLMGIMAIITFVYSQWHPEWEKKHLIFSNINIITILLLCLIFLYENTPLVMIFHRLLNWFTIIYIVILPLLLAEMRLRSNRRIFIVMISCVFTALCYIALELNGDANNLIPYKTIFY